MYHHDPNINTAIERQADRVREVRAYGSNERAAPTRPAGEMGQSKRVARKAILALAAAVPIVLIVAVVLAR